MMPEWLRRLRGVLGVGLVGTGIGTVLAGVLISVLRVIAPELIPLGPAVAWGGVFALSMGLCGSLFGTVLTIVGRGESLDSLSRGKTAFLGALAGAVTPLLVALAIGMGWTADGVPILTWLASVGAVAGAGLGLGVVGVAKGAGVPRLAGGVAALELQEGPQASDEEIP